MDYTDLKEKEERLVRELAEVQEQQRELGRLTPAQRVAELLHKKDCRQNHTDGCSWHYESWQKPGWARNLYLERARKLLAELDNNELAANSVIYSIFWP